MNKSIYEIKIMSQSTHLTYFQMEESGIDLIKSFLKLGFYITKSVS